MELYSYFSPNTIKNTILKEIELAEKEILIAVSWFTDETLFKAIRNKALEISVKLIILNDGINNRPNGLNWRTFIYDGGDLYFSKSDLTMHHKFCIIDRSTLLTGSYNWTYNAENNNHENLLIIKDDKELISNYVREFEKLLKGNIKVNEVSPIDIHSEIDSSALGITNYLSQEAYLQAVDLIKCGGDNNKALNLVNFSLNLNPKNEDVQQKFKSLAHTVQKWKPFKLISFNENEIVINFKTNIEHAVWINGPGSKYEWFLRDSQNRQHLTKSVKITEIKLENKIISEELLNGSIVYIDSSLNKDRNSHSFERANYHGFYVDDSGNAFNHLGHPINYYEFSCSSNDLLECTIHFETFMNEVNIVDIIEGDELGKHHWNYFYFPLISQIK